MGRTKYDYDYLGRRNDKATPSLLYNQVSTVHEFFGFDAAGSLLSWSRQNLVAPEAGTETIEEYVYVAGERIAKVVTERTLAVVPDPGTGGGGGCCCATTAVAYDGKPFCDLAAYHALQVFRGFRNTVLSGNTFGEAFIRFYYRDLSPAAVAVFREYPELRHAMNYVLRASAWVLEFWVAPAVAAEPPTLPSTVTVYWYHNDHLGTPLALSDAGGNVVASWVRDPFGNVVSKSGSVDDNNLFPGQFMDSTSGLVYNWNRWYSPEIGRYVEADPLRASSLYRPFLDAKMPGRFNNYQYALNNPLLLSDPTGLKECCKSGICDCPSGKWSGWAGGLSYVGGGVGAEYGGGQVSCWDNGKTLTFEYSCMLIGGGPSFPPLMVGYGGFFGSLWCFGPKCIEDITGSSLGAAVSFPLKGALGGVGGADWGKSGCYSVGFGIGTVMGVVRSCTVNAVVYQ